MPTSKSGREFKFAERDGVQVRIYDNGAVQRADNGHWLEPPTTAKITTSEQGRQLAQRKKELAQERAIEGLDEAAIEAGLMPEQAPSGEGWKYINKHLATALFKSKNARGQAEIANFLGKSTGHTTAQLDSPENIAHSITQLFSKFLDHLPHAETVEGKVIND